jgi:DNA-binding NtrC family response regulator
VAMLLTDERMPGMGGIDLLARVVERWPEVVRVIVSAYSDAPRLLRAINRGHAHEYMLKPWLRTDMAACINRGLAIYERHRELLSRAELYSDSLAPEPRSASWVDASPSLEKLLAQARRVAGSEVPVLIRGEMGTGKELLARYIHQQGSRAHGSFLRVDCGAQGEEDLWRWIAGEEKTTLAGVNEIHRGRLELAHHGTVYFDEVAVFPPRFQAALLRLVEDGMFVRTRGAAPVKCNARIICATARDLEQQVRNGTFREDLLLRINVLPLQLPPLRERPGDLGSLISHFIAKHLPKNVLRPRVEPEVLAALSRYQWPGNARELENLVQRALVLATEDTLTLDDFCLRLSVGSEPEEREGDVREEAQMLERERMRDLLLMNGGNVARAARGLGVPRTTFLSRAKKMGLL